jgi:histidine ammonia-lyase
MATHAARRLIAMAENAAGIVGIEFLAACRGIHFHAPLATGPRLKRAFALVEGEPAIVAEDHFLAPDIEKAQRLVLDGALARAVGPDALPRVDPGA